MPSRALHFLCLTTVLALSVPAAAQAAETAASEAVAASTIVSTAGGGGAAVHIGDGKYLTAAHVVSGSAEVVLLTAGTPRQARVAAVDLNRDLALLRASPKGAPAVAFATATPEVGETVYAVGAPAGDYLQVTSGILSAALVFDGVETLQTDAAVNPGNSGGPLVNSDGELIGIVVAKSEVSEGIAWATSLSEVAAFLSDAATSPAGSTADRSVADPGPDSQTPSSSTFSAPTAVVAAATGLTFAAWLVARGRRRPHTTALEPLDLSHENLGQPHPEKEKRQWKP